MNFHYLEDVLFLLWKLIINYESLLLFFFCVYTRGNCENVKSQRGKILFEAMFYDQFECYQRKKKCVERPNRNANKNCGLEANAPSPKHTWTIRKFHEKFLRSSLFILRLKGTNKLFFLFLYFRQQFSVFLFCLQWSLGCNLMPLCRRH